MNVSIDSNVDRFEPYFDEIVRILVTVDDPRLMGDFLKSILTPTEVAEVASRWALVRHIDEGESQRKISRDLGLSLCKITRGSKELKKENSPFRQMIELYKETFGEDL